MARMKKSRPLGQGQKKFTGSGISLGEGRRELGKEERMKHRKKMMKRREEEREYHYGGSKTQWN